MAQDDDCSFGDDALQRVFTEKPLDACVRPQQRSGQFNVRSGLHVKSLRERDFFKRYDKVYRELAAEIAQTPSLKNAAGKSAQRLIDGLTFLYFIQEKGWLDGRHDYLYARFLECNGQDPDGVAFHADVLHPLLQCLSNRAAPPRGVRTVPFLNERLIELLDGAPLRKEGAGDRVWIRNQAFKPVFEDLLERFDFTLTERASCDAGFAVDPEMLGKVYENLILQMEKASGRDRRKRTGSYYTPRSIVHFMCREGLAEYLAARLVPDEKLKSPASPRSERAAVNPPKGRTANDQFFDAARKRADALLAMPPADQLIGGQKRLLEGLLTRAEARTLRQAILTCHACDPAVGSGAFLVGMLHEIAAAVARLDMRLHGRRFLERRNYFYDLKRLIAESCLYGVDLQKEAVRLCELRLWLSLIVDYEMNPAKPFDEAIREMPALPDLSRHLVWGDSLLERHGPQPDTSCRRNPDTPPRQTLRGDALPEFEWRMAFADIFEDKGGFDVVIANPPYVSFGLRGAASAKNAWNALVRRLYPGSAEYKISLYALFLDVALRIARKRAPICCITPDSFLLGRYFSKIRRSILDNASIRKFVMFERNFWKTGVIGRPVISLFLRNGSPGNVTAILARDDESLLAGPGRKHSYCQNYFETMPHNRFRLFFSPVAMDFVRRVEAGAAPLKSVARIVTGVRSRSGQQAIIATHPSDWTDPTDPTGSTGPMGSTWKKGIVSSAQVLPYRVTWEGHYLNIDRGLLWAGGWDASIVERPKLLIRQTGDSLVAALDRDRHLYHLNNVHSLAPLSKDVSLEYLCVLLNSRLMNRYYHLISLERGRPMAQTDIETLELLPIRAPDPSLIRPIEALFKDIHNPETQRENERLLAKQYGLTPALVQYLRGDDLYPAIRL